ncbi:flagellin [Geobacillus thermodenitrificans]|uniref:flagellin N-terminal helical domain-containing protein n=1 Tax=Geobacillus thermodenitrificans TaxID=33940 RepID=UPI000408DC70|nr:flagellin [Geobacillus thermodenitrificans]ARA98477.1 flagellin [Geobacillus thermodenitrificans]
MRINHNIAALNTYRQLTIGQGAATKNMEKLSSGLRINRAGDDAAGLAISEKMRGQIRGLEMASKNAQDAISLIQTAEGALNETHSILQRMRELAVQAANDTNTADDRAEIQKEINQLKDEIDRISETTEFNTKKLLNGNVAITATVGETNEANIGNVEVVNARLASGAYTLQVTDTDNQEVTNIVDAGTGMGDSDISIQAGEEAKVKYGSYQLKIADDAQNSGKKVFTLVDAATGEVVAKQNNVGVGSGTSSITLAGITFDTTKVTGNGTVSFDVEGDHTFTLMKDSDTIATVTVTDFNRSEVEIAGLKLSFNYNIANGNTTITIVDNSLLMHIGANEGQTMNVGINNMSSQALGVSDVDITSTSGAEEAITSIDNAIKQVSAERSKLGAYQNRLEHTINNLGTSAENLTAAESRIRDVDMAKEMMEFTKNNILMQASQAMLAQSNQLPQAVLQLLR